MKSKVKKVLKIILIILVIIIMLPFVLVGTIMVFVPITRPDEAVRSYVLKRIPMGTDWDEAIELFEKKEWEIAEEQPNCGLLIYATGSTTLATEERIDFASKYAQSEFRVVGVKFMRVELGEYYNPFHTAVFAFMVFDENNELVEVTIRRDCDTL